MNQAVTGLPNRRGNVLGYASGPVVEVFLDRIFARWDTDSKWYFTYDMKDGRTPLASAIRTLGRRHAPNFPEAVYTSFART